MFAEIAENAAAGTVSFSVRVQPRASKDEVAGVMGGALKIRLQAPAVENRANEALVEFLAQLLKHPSRLLEFFPASAAARSTLKFAA